MAGTTIIRPHGSCYHGERIRDAPAKVGYLFSCNLWGHGGHGGRGGGAQLNDDGQIWTDPGDVEVYHLEHLRLISYNVEDGDGQKIRRWPSASMFSESSSLPLDSTGWFHDFDSTRWLLP